MINEIEESRNLPIGIQSFEVIRSGGYVYVDKTALMFKLASTSIPYFLSRPRRFGKSLLISVFQAYFEGRKDLFKDLAVSRLESKWDEYPVLRLDLNAETYDSLASLKAILSDYLDKWEDVWGRDERERTLSRRFAGVIQRAYRTSGRRVVVLIDEYDKPMLSAILNSALLEEFRKTLKGFYGVLKSSSDYLRFIFITGVTNFAQVSVFSDLNQLVDISMDEEYTEICGISKDELLKNFRPELEAVAAKQGLSFEETIARMTKKYDGYHFGEHETGMFNPFSVLNALNTKKLGDYWFKTGTPTYLVELLKQSDYDLRKLVDGVELADSDFTEYRAEPDNPIPMIYQSGYLTIKSYDESIGLYTLGFPNDEVRYGFLKFLVPYVTTVPSGKAAFHIGHFAREIRDGEVDAFMTRLKVFFAGMSYELSNNNERHYQAIFYVVFTLLGQFVESEVRSADGRADAVVKTKDCIYVFEFKLDGTAEEALAQIDDKDYTIPYSLDGRKILKIGVNFSKETRNIEKWEKG